MSRISVALKEGGIIYISSNMNLFQERERAVFYGYDGGDIVLYLEAVWMIWLKCIK